jgi:hemoglobin
MNATQQSLYDRLGGEQAIAAITKAFYARVLKDVELRPFFEHTQMEKQISMQNAFLGQALGGPMTYTGKPLAYAHQGMGITTHHFAKFVEHFLETLHDFDVSDEDADAVISRLNTLSNDITGKSY